MKAPSHPKTRSTSEGRVATTVAATVADTVWPWRPTEVSDRHEAEAAHAARQGFVRGLVGLAATILIYVYWGPAPAAIVAGITTVVMVLALVSPLGAYRRLNGWIARFAHAVGLGMTWLLMPLIYFLVFLPVGLLLRLRGRLRLNRRLDSEAQSYWTVRDDEKATSHDYRRQF